MALTLVIGNKKYSSWSLRPWIAMKVADIAFNEKVIPLYQADSKEEILRFSPAGKVPVLIDGDMIIWESIAILDHLNDRFPSARLWPVDPKARAHARAISAEMHCGFADLRNHCLMNMARVGKPRPDMSPVRRSVARIDALWSDARARFGAGGPFLFGAFTAADAMYAPVVSRFVSYGIEASAPARAYIDAIAALPAWTEWKEAGLQEPWVMPTNELD